MSELHEPNYRDHPSPQDALKTMERRTERAAVNWATVRAFVDRAQSVTVSEASVVVKFSAGVDAGEFARLLVKAGRGE